ncbi:peptidase M14 [Bacillaceae bacterium SIJ1]|uniref:M14 family metallopeptidase n=1 Tax=Litoribacterium kuwaitense TaxID=1398745 RepID=UPI0013EDA8BE|nr:M14 family metallocarboxypeptidase [Litoribacterium kuwaitense]NGP43566.1 peptidase M14 [Litoribacterium kuwaitense]
MNNHLPTISHLYNRITRLEERYPFVRVQTIGHSVLRRPIFEVSIGEGSRQLHANASFHAHEWITSLSLLEFLETYAYHSAYSPNSHWALTYQETNLSTVPIVNPDGVALLLDGVESAGEWQNDVLSLNRNSYDFTGWKANIRGVDLNNQFPAGWEIEQQRKPQAPAHRDYPGPKPLSEPEALAMEALVSANDFEQVVAFHTQGKVIYWGYQHKEPTVSRQIVTSFQNVCGYEPVQTIDSHAGFKDWFIQTHRRPGFTVELGKGINPLPLSMYREIYQATEQIMAAFLKTKDSC